jgi:hypothetical protein
MNVRGVLGARIEPRKKSFMNKSPPTLRRGRRLK